MRALLCALTAALALTACGDGGPGDTLSVLYQVDTTVLESREHGPQLCLGGTMLSMPPQCGGPDVVGLDWADVPDKRSEGDTTWAGLHLVGTYDAGAKRFTLTEKPTPPPPAPPREEDSDRFKPGCDSPSAVNPDSTAREVEFPDSLDKHLVAAWATDPGPGDGRYVFTVVVKPGHGSEAERGIRTAYDGALCVVERDGPTAEELDRIQAEMIEASDRIGGVLTGAPDYKRGAVVMTVILADRAARGYAKQRWGDKVVLESALKPAGSTG